MHRKWRDPLKHYLTIFTLFLITSATISPSFSQELTNERVSQAYYKSYNYEKSGNYDDAIKALQLVYQKYSNAYGINNRLGYLYRLNHHYKNAETHYRQAITALPDSLTPKSGLMYVYLLSKNYEKASKTGYQIISIDFYNYYANLRLAYILRQIENFEMAEKILIKMLVRYPSDTLYLTELGLLTLKTNDIKRSKSIMQEVLILDPENVDAKSVLLSLHK